MFFNKPLLTNQVIALRRGKIFKTAVSPHYIQDARNAKIYIPLHGKRPAAQNGNQGILLVNLYNKINLTAPQPPHSLIGGVTNIIQRYNIYIKHIRKTIIIAHQR